MTAASNGSGAIPSYEAILAVRGQAAAEREVDQVHERLVEERAHRERLEAELAAVNEKLAKLAAPPAILRSRLTAKEKSTLIAELGPQGYLALPWSDDQERKEARSSRSPNWR